MKSILFSAPMVRALQADTKTQTRRAMRDQPCTLLDFNRGHLSIRVRGAVYQAFSPKFPPVPCPYGHPGDLLRVKEAAWMWCERRPNGKTKTGRDKWNYVPLRSAPVHYAADHQAKPTAGVVSPDTGNQWGWRLKIGRFLPAWASRITLEVTGVRVEQLQDISEADAIAEGVQTDPACPAYEGYAVLWEQINGPGSWRANPWVWVVEFKKVPA